MRFETSGKRLPGGLPLGGGWGWPAHAKVCAFQPVRQVQGAHTHVCASRGPVYMLYVTPVPRFPRLGYRGAPQVG